MVNERYVIDTHIFLWYMDADRRLSRRAKSILDHPDNRFLLPAIALAEALFILERRPGLYNLTEESLLRQVRADERIAIVALDEVTVARSIDCKAIPEMHDRQIVATALLAQEAGVDVAILTKDANITDSGLIPCLW